MATISFNGASYTVNHAVKGADYVHGYDANGVLVVSFEGVSDFSAISYSGTYMTADKCADEACNVVRYVNGQLQKADGTALGIGDLGGVSGSHNHSASNITSGTLPVARGGTGNTSVDTSPTSGSSKMVTSGGVYTALSGKANSSHTHGAGDITSGTLPVARGGTGVTSNPSMLTNLGSTSAASVFAASPRPGVTGTLPVANGGTGQTSVDTTPTSGSSKMVTSGGVYTALSGKANSSHKHAAGDITSGTLAVARGGTGVTSMDALLSAMGAAKFYVGSYAGTGTYGKDAPNSLTLPFDPKLLIIMPAKNLKIDSGENPVIFVFGSGGTVTAQALSTDYGSEILNPTYSNRTLTWYHTGRAAHQLSTSGTTYYYYIFA